MPEKSQQKQPAQKKAKKHLPAVSAVIKKTEKVSATGHQHTEIRNKKEATCKEEGYSGDTWCKDCGKKILSGQTIAKTENHSWNQGEITKEPTCKEEGEKTFTCSICGDEKTEKISATGHQHTEIRR